MASCFTSQGHAVRTRLPSFRPRRRGREGKREGDVLRSWATSRSSQPLWQQCPGIRTRVAPRQAECSFPSALGLEPGASRAGVRCTEAEPRNPSGGRDGKARSEAYRTDGLPPVERTEPRAQPSLGHERCSLGLGKRDRPGPAEALHPGDSTGWDSTGQGRLGAEDPSCCVCAGLCGLGIPGKSTKETDRVWCWIAPLPQVVQSSLLCSSTSIPLPKFSGLAVRGHRCPCSGASLITEPPGECGPLPPSSLTPSPARLPPFTPEPLLLWAIWRVCSVQPEQDGTGERHLLSLMFMMVRCGVVWAVMSDIY